MRKTHWEVARAAQTMGVVLSLHVDPKQITPRIRTKALKWLREGYADGGYYSKARQLVDLLAKGFGFSLVVHNYYGLAVDYPEQETVATLIELKNADWAAYVLDAPARNSGWHAEKYRHSLAALTGADTNRRMHLNFENRHFLTLAGRAAGKDAYARQQEAIDAAIEALSGDQLIPIATH